MKKKLTSILIMCTLMISTIIIVGSSSACVTPEPVRILYPCTTWSQDDQMVDLGTNTWSLLNGQARVSGYHIEPTTHCICKCCIDFTEPCDYTDCCYTVPSHLTHTGTRGLGVLDLEDDQIDSINQIEFLEITFNEVQDFRYCEIRSLFIEDYNGQNVAEEGDAILFLGETAVRTIHFRAKESSGYGSLIIPILSAVSEDRQFNKIIFFVQPGQSYTEYSEYSVAKIVTEKHNISFLDPIEGIDCNYPPVADAGGPYVGFLGTGILLDGSGSYDPDGQIMNWKWTYSYDNGPIQLIGYGETIIFNAPKPGLYKISLSVADGNPTIDIDTTELNVIDPNGDDDGDGIINVDEDVNNDGDPTNDDTDNNGIANYQDPDDDGDKIPTHQENFEDGANFGIDVDQDGVPNYLDIESDGDGALDYDEGTIDHDGDGKPNYLDPNDEDGPDGDIDGDGVKNYEDNCKYTYNPDQTDTDGDGIGDVCDDITDSDNDGIPDDQDNCPTTYNPDQTDTDGDGIGDVCDDITDSDNDGIPDDQDNCPTTYNPDQTDSDNDGIGDVCDSTPQPYVPPSNNPPVNDNPPANNDDDTDGDGVPDDEDNCPDTYNPDQKDNDGDGIGDVCDDDDDNDGIPDNEDDDIDGDGYTNEDEIECGSDPQDANSVPEDYDHDFIPDCVDDDDDNDGYPDEDEIECGSDPQDANSVPEDNDQDGIADCVDPDDDNDNVPDETEDHNNNGDNVDDDNDGDGIPDYQDPDDDNDGKLTKDEDPNHDGNPTNDDSDGDEIPDYLDPTDNKINPVKEDNIFWIITSILSTVLFMGPVGLIIRRKYYE